MEKITFAQAINQAIDEAMQIDESVICFGLGVTDPKGVFGTTIGLEKKYGNNRVFDMPTSENGMTGVAIGAALNGIRPIMTHQRFDFFLLAMDQLVNNAAKWHYMFGGQSNVPITIRLIIGRGWGQGPTHSQNLHAWLAHIPGLKVVIPTNAYDAKGLLFESIFDENPVLFLEHRWLHNQIAEVPNGEYRIPIGVASILREGDDVTVISTSYLTVEALHAIDFVHEKYGINCDLIDLRSIKPIDWEKIMTSVYKTGRLLVLDTGWETGSLAGEIIARVTIERFQSLKRPPIRIALPDCPTPTSIALTEYYYSGSDAIAKRIAELMEISINVEGLKQQRSGSHDVPGDWFKGPF